MRLRSRLRAPANTTTTNASSSQYCPRLPSSAPNTVGGGSGLMPCVPLVMESRFTRTSFTISPKPSVTIAR